MNTLFLLMARHEGRAVLPPDVVCKEYFAPLTLPVFMRKLNEGEIPLPLVRLDRSQKGPKVIDIRDLAAYIDQQREAAAKELRQLRA
ncbi:pyocin activator PrtN family protein [Cereibacter johrii]|uniref:pyocin activator PrtN family protein n=1 Tax=Cereibacter johrii TaxID=445629 RepID=UPI000DCC9811|nr:pyocin activator PrtN family protein [Cereibacter johrii]RAZ86921.1 Pyocin activator protein PrtN [Cereibacter johrii]